MIKSFNDFKLESLNESIVYFSPRMRQRISSIDSDISKKLLDIEGTDINALDVTFIDADEEGDVTFITMPNAMKLIKAKYPQATNADLDVSANTKIADILFQNDMNHLMNGRTDGDSGIYLKSRNSIKIGKLVNKIFKGTLKAQEVEKFVNDFKASSIKSKEEIQLISGEDIKYWYNSENYLSLSGTLGSSCMAGKPGKFFNIYSENPNSCSLLIMTVDGKLVSRGLVWKINSIKGDGIKDDNRPEYFLDRVYAIEDYQIEKMRKFAIDKGWAVRKYNSGYEISYISWGKHSYQVSMSVKVKKSDYGNTYPYMDTFKRYDHFNGLLWNDETRRKGGHILQSTIGDYKPSIPKRQVYINRFKDFFRKEE